MMPCPMVLIVKSKSSRSPLAWIDNGLLRGAVHVLFALMTTCPLTQSPAPTIELPTDCRRWD
ncbi:MAG: hypothetical protein R3E08_11800 [Thiotrichaceae bacterium]